MTDKLMDCITNPIKCKLLLYSLSYNINSDMATMVEEN